MNASEVQRALRLITSASWKRTNRFPITVLAAMSGLSRQTIYQARNGKGLTHRVVNVLSTPLRDILNGTLQATWQAHYTVGVSRAEMEERQFFHDGSVGNSVTGRRSRPAVILG